MSIELGSNLLLQSKSYIDARQTPVESLSTLYSWDFVKTPLPEGFLIFCTEDENIYQYKSSNNEAITRKFNLLSFDETELRNLIDTKQDELTQEQLANVNATYATVATSGDYNDLINKFNITDNIWSGTQEQWDLLTLEQQQSFIISIII